MWTKSALGGVTEDHTRRPATAEDMRLLGFVRQFDRDSAANKDGAKREERKFEMRGRVSPARETILGTWVL